MVAVRKGMSSDCGLEADHSLGSSGGSFILNKKTCPSADMFLISEAHFIHDLDFNRNPASISGGAVSEKHNGRICFKPFLFFSSF